MYTELTVIAMETMLIALQHRKCTYKKN